MQIKGLPRGLKMAAGVDFPAAFPSYSLCGGGDGLSDSICFDLNAHSLSHSKCFLRFSRQS